MTFPKPSKNNLFSLDQEIQSRKLTQPNSLVLGQSPNSPTTDINKTPRNSSFVPEQAMQANSNNLQTDTESESFHQAKAFRQDYKVEAFENKTSETYNTSPKNTSSTSFSVESQPTIDVEAKVVHESEIEVDPKNWTAKRRVVSSNH